MVNSSRPQAEVVAARACRQAVLLYMPRKGGARKELRLLRQLVDELLPSLGSTLLDMVRRSERLITTFQCGRWNQVSGGLVCIDYGNQEYAAVLGLFASVDVDVADSLERLARFWPTLSMRSPYTDAAEELGDVLEGPLPELFNKLFSLMRLVQKIDSWTTGYVKWKQTRVQRMRTILPTTAEFLDQWDEGSHRWPCLLVALYRLIRHIEDMSERVRITME